MHIFRPQTFQREPTAKIVEAVAVHAIVFEQRPFRAERFRHLLCLRHAGDGGGE